MILFDFLTNIMQFIFHIDQNLFNMVSTYGFFVYPIIFLIIFCETGLVVAPFLPGDSLLFAAGALAGAGMLNLALLFGLIFLAALLGDNVNYFVGKHLGRRAFSENSRFFKKEYLLKTQAFYDKYGVKTIIFARFFPILRTFSPFVAGIGSMPYKKFFIFDLLGSIVWISIFLLAGFFFGGIPLIKNNFTLFILGIICVSLIPFFIGIIRSLIKKN